MEDEQEVKTVFEHDYPEEESRNYGRACWVGKLKGLCLVCKKETEILTANTSDGEYCGFDCCLPCFTNLITDN